jgi:hypothetical protein
VQLPGLEKVRHRCGEPAAMPAVRRVALGKAIADRLARDGMTLAVNGLGTDGRASDVARSPILGRRSTSATFEDDKCGRVLSCSTDRTERDSAHNRSGLACTGQEAIGEK